VNVTAYDLAQRFVGLKEVPGVASNPLVLGMLRLDVADVQGDDVAWCSAFVNFIAWMLRLPRSKSLAARSWLGIGQPVELRDAKAGFDVVVLQRGSGPQPGPDVIAAPGHVGFYSGMSGGNVVLLGGNQGDAVTLAQFSSQRILGIRRLA
jgi:uncharacterized protein (TIGR02594 family)